MKPGWQWDETDLQNLIGTQESMRLEFKSGRLFEDTKDKIAEALSKEVSAFANSEGGVLLLGMAEEKVRGKPGGSVAKALDGIPVADGRWSTETVQRLIEGNLSPHLPGIRVRAVPLSEFSGTKIALVVVVPAGSTAYQASDRRYYGRSEYEAKALPDHEVRLRMARGKTPRVTIEATNVHAGRTAQEVFEVKLSKYIADVKAMFKQMERIAPESSAQAEAASDEEPQTLDPARVFGEQWRSRFFSEYSFDLSIRNDGELSIRDFELDALVTCASGFIVSERETLQPDEGFLGPPASSPVRIRGRLSNFISRASNDPEVKLWPQALRRLCTVTLLVPWEQQVGNSELRVTWKVYLDDAPPSYGEITAEALFGQVNAPSDVIETT